MPAITVRGVTLLPPRDTAPTNFKILVPVMANDLSNAAYIWSIRSWAG